MEHRLPVSPVPPERLRWRCPADCLEFATTADLRPAEGIVGQEEAAAALRFGLSIDAAGQNVFVRGLTGSGRLTLVRDLLRKVRPATPPGRDRCYVHDFARSDRPRLLSLEPGAAPAFEARMVELIRFVREDLTDIVNTDALRVRTHDVEARANREATEVSAPFDRALAEAGLALVGVESEDGTEPAIVPIVDGEPTAFADLDAKVEAKAFDPKHAEQLHAAADRFEVMLDSVSAQVVRIRRRAQRAIRSLVQQEALRVLRDAVADIRRTWPEAAEWLDALVTDASTNFGTFEEHPERVERYRVNVLETRDPSGPRPVVIENMPTVQNLLGSIDPILGDDPASPAPHTGIHGGSMLEADGGTLILNARDVLAEPMAWNALKRTLRTGMIELSPFEATQSTIRPPGVKPEPIPVRVKVVLVGEPDVWYALDDQDPDFPHLFKVLVDFDDVIPRTPWGIARYGEVVARIVRDEALPPFTSGAIGALVEQGAREAEEGGRLTARFGRIADIVREASFVARARGASVVEAHDVAEAIQAGMHRGDLPGRKFREQILNGRVRVRTTGEAVGEVLGLAVISSGPVGYGFPTRITATVGPGKGGAVHIEREAELSGHIHTKGFLILRGLMRYLLRSPHPISFDASLTHEQSYGGIDGDSASGAEFCCLLSALTGLPVRQSLAMTGAVDQHGNILPIGAVNEKIEGFYDVCAAAGLDGRHGVIIPKSNVEDLQLRADVAEACAAGEFAVYAVDRVEEAIELLFSRPAGDSAGEVYADGTVLAAAVRRAAELWLAAKAEP